MYMYVYMCVSIIYISVIVLKILQKYVFCITLRVLHQNRRLFKFLISPKDINVNYPRVNLQKIPQ